MKVYVHDEGNVVVVVVVEAFHKDSEASCTAVEEERSVEVFRTAGDVEVGIVEDVEVGIGMVVDIGKVAGTELEVDLVHHGNI